ncbi:SMP-30/gluconolactonase/LRE family protein [Glaciibacter sp. 2TAF33]|uniref:SMP-30/gluconolactonase/LRE family protein n=1 Tax=Glaciibacter sp. 2TAF33 TaxID=3233015 RepID=UPI003F8E1151
MRYPVTELARGLGFVEGPVALEDGAVLFTDIGAGLIMRLDPDGSIDVFADVGGGPNGLATTSDGGLLVCNNGGMGIREAADGFLRPNGTRGTRPVDPCIQRVNAHGRVEAGIASHRGGSFVAPNDLVLDAYGGCYITDFGAVHGRLVDPGGVYYAKANGRSHIADELVHVASPPLPLTQPNGVGLSPDGDTLYVAETASGRLWSWAVIAPGVLGPGPQPTTANGATLVYAVEGYAFFDSLAVDPDGYICVATVRKGGISVIAPDGELEAFIPMPVFDPAVTNICFSPEGDTAYVTAAGTGRLYAIDWRQPGRRSRSTSNRPPSVWSKP